MGVAAAQEQLSTSLKAINKLGRLFHPIWILPLFVPEMLPVIFVKGRVSGIDL